MLRRLILSVILLCGFAGLAPADDSPVPERRVVTSTGQDFYGADIGSIFDTTFRACRTACLGNPACNALTYNTGASACFLKSGIERREPFAGAISAELIPTPEATRALAATRAAELDFVPRGLLDAARTLAETLGARFAANGRAPEALHAEGLAAEEAGNPLAAAQSYASAVTADDSAAGWRDLARVWLLAEGEDRRETRRLRADALSAALNGYLRSEGAEARANGLFLLANALEQRGYGREMITALRASQELAPREGTEARLAYAISNYGFRVVSHEVDSEAADARLCVQFSERLSEAGVDYAPFVRIEGGAALPVVVEDAQLCVEGVERGTRYRLTVREGLPARDGEALAASVPIESYVRDRSPSVRFAGRGHVLPQSAQAAIPVVTVNMTEVDLAVYRLSERSLVPAIQDNLFDHALSRWREDQIAGRTGEAVWKGSAEVSGAVNADVTTALPIGEAIETFEPGVYAMTARAPGDTDNWDRVATQWFIVTDLGLQSLSGTDGLHVFVRALSSAGPVAGAEVALVALNNDVIATADADAQGYARFDAGLTRGQGGAAPALISVHTEGDFAFLDLTGPAFDLSDRGVEGRAAPGPVDVFATTERGVYRPGEPVHFTALVRDGEAQAIPDLPLTLVVTRPDGVEYHRQVLPDAGAGGRAHSMRLGRGAARGTWSARFHVDPKAPPVRQISFLVEDFVPERLDATLTAPEGLLAASESLSVDVEARYLYGAPGADLAVEGEVRVTAAEGLPGFPGFRFGLAEEQVGGLSTRSEPVVTDASGVARISLDLPETASLTRPLLATAIVRVRDNAGRPVERRLTRPVAPAGVQIGIRPLFEEQAPEGGTAAFEVVAVGPDGQQIALDQVGWTLSKVNRRWQWYAVNGRWNYEPITSRERVANGTVALTADGRARIEASVDWGAYELKLAGLSDTPTAASLAFNAGWYAVGATADTPDMLEIGLDKVRHRLGETVRVRLKPRHAGKVLVSVVDNRLIETHALNVEAGETTLDLEVTEAWGPGAYVTATLVRPGDAAAGRNPARALGLTWAGVDPGDRQLDLAFVSPTEADPRGPLEARVQVADLTPGIKAHVTIAAVDVGILNLTGFEAPAPDAHYFAQRALGVEMRDLYGRLIDGHQGVLGRLRSGGDAAAARLQAPPPTEALVAYFSGVLDVGADGSATARFELPDFNGTVRLMAVAWTDRATGHAVQDVLVRDPIVVSAAMPRFLAPGDRTRIALDLTHTKGPEGTVSVTLSGDGRVDLASEPQQVVLAPGGRARIALPLTAAEIGDSHLEVATRTRIALDLTHAKGPEGPVSVTLSGDGRVDLASEPQQVVLAPGGRARVALPLTAAEIGDSHLEVATRTPDGQVLTKRLTLPVRLLDPETARRSRIPLPAGGRFAIGPEVFEGLQSGTGRATLAAGALAVFDAPGLLTALDRYPYGCTEQVTSRALPLLYMGPMAEALGLAPATDLAQRIDGAIARVLENQTSAGSFGLWHPDRGDLWLDAYVTDFLSRARAVGHAVPEGALRAALDNLQSALGYAPDFELGGEDIAYALMVLAREGRASIGDLRYYADTKAEAFATPMAQAQLGAALAFYGEQTRADAMFRLAEAGALDAADGTGWRADYGSDLRDGAAVLALTAEAGSEAVDRRRLTRALADRAEDRTSTQEKVWMLLASHAAMQESNVQLLVNGQPTGDRPLRTVRPEDVASGALVLENTGAATDLLLTTFGVPEVPEPAGGQGYAITREYFTLDGEPVSPAAVAQNTRLAVVLTITSEESRAGRLMVDDPLPAGFEIDNPNLLQSGSVAALDWLNISEDIQSTEFRTERFRAAVDHEGRGSFQLAYLVRAVSPGQFRHSAATVEDMYRPAFRAWTGSGEVTVVPSR